MSSKLKKIGENREKIRKKIEELESRYKELDDKYRELEGQEVYDIVLSANLDPEKLTKIFKELKILDDSDDKDTEDDDYKGEDYYVTDEMMETDYVESYGDYKEDL